MRSYHKCALLKGEHANLETIPRIIVRIGPNFASEEAVLSGAPTAGASLKTRPKTLLAYDV